MLFRCFVLVALLSWMTVGVWGCSAQPTNNQSSGAPDGGTNPDSSGTNQCIGVDPTETGGAWNPETPKACEGKPGSCVGSPMPNWTLKDFQPQSCGFEKKYGIRAFRGKVTVLVLLASWCGFCQMQIEKLERMRLELASQGKDVNFVVVNQEDAVDTQKEFVDRSGIPLFQDTAEAKVFAMQGGGKDDMFVYNSKGFLVKYLPFSGDVDINLSGEGYNNLKKAIESAE